VHDPKAAVGGGRDPVPPVVVGTQADADGLVDLGNGLCFRRDTR
jgi:hypothetical protein